MDPMTVRYINEPRMVGSAVDNGDFRVWLFTDTDTDWTDLAALGASWENEEDAPLTQPTYDDYNNQYPNEDWRNPDTDRLAWEISNMQFDGPRDVISPPPAIVGVALIYTGGPNDSLAMAATFDGGPRLLDGARQTLDFLMSWFPNLGTMEVTQIV